MPILAPLKPFFDGMNASSGARDERPPAEARAAWHAMIDASFGAFSDSHEPLASEKDITIPVAGGEITIRVYSPVPAGAPRPCHLNFHGGGFWLGTLAQSDSLCRGLATDAGCVVVSVDYRLAPEDKFPAAAEDCYAALVWVADHAGDLGVDPSRISVGGASAGGNLAAVVALMARDRGGPPLVLQLLEIPVTDFTRLEPLEVPAEGLVVQSGKEEYRGFYLNGAAEATNPYASPLLAPDLTGLPPAMVMCAEYDPLKPEGEAYAKRLAEAGVPVEYRCWDGQFHGSQRMSSIIPEESAAFKAEVARALRQAYGTET